MRAIVWDPIGREYCHASDDRAKYMIENGMRSQVRDSYTVSPPHVRSAGSTALAPSGRPYRAITAEDAYYISIGRVDLVVGSGS